MSKVSVLMPTFNRPEWLGVSSDSVLKQDCDLELLILDHGSEPATKEALDKITDPRVRKFRIEVNGSEGSPYVYLSKFATGDYMVLWTDDDVMVEGTLKRKVEVLDNDPDIGMVCTSAFHVGADGEVVKSSIGKPHHETVLKGAMPLEMLFQANFVTMMSAVFRREFVDALERAHESEIGQTPLGDWAFWLELASETDIAYLDMESVIIRLHEGSDSAQRGMKQGGFLKAMIQVWDHWINRGILVTEEMWDRMRLGYLSVAISTPGKDMDFLFDHVSKFENFKAANRGSHV